MRTGRVWGATHHERSVLPFRAPQSAREDGLLLAPLVLSRNTRRPRHSSCSALKPLEHPPDALAHGLERITPCVRACVPVPSAALAGANEREREGESGQRTLHDKQRRHPPPRAHSRNRRPDARVRPRRQGKVCQRVATEGVDAEAARARARGFVGRVRSGSGRWARACPEREREGGGVRREEGGA